jgi:hypothetical protein
VTNYDGPSTEACWYACDEYYNRNSGPSGCGAVKWLPGKVSTALGDELDCYFLPRDRTFDHIFQPTSEAGTDPRTIILSRRKCESIDRLLGQ